jgi:hypothetical protein
MTRRTGAFVGAVIIAVVISLQHLFMGPAVIGLSVGFALSYVAWIATYYRQPRARKRLLLLYALATSVQCLHLIEEYVGSFHEEFPKIWGYEWGREEFLTFHLIGIAIFIVAGVGLTRRIRLSYLFVWILALVGGLGNGLLHLLATLVRLEYFPGAATAVTHLLVGLLLLRELLSPQRTDSSHRRILD